MATTAYGVNDALAVKLWSKGLEAEVLKKTWVSKFMGKGSNSLIQIKATITRRTDPTRLIIDFSGSSPQRTANVNATEGITRSCVFYVIRYLLSVLGDVPTNYGLFQPVELILPNNSQCGIFHCQR